MDFPHRLNRLAGFDYRAPRTYFVTFHAQERVPIFREPIAASIACGVLLDFRGRGWYALHAYCVMPDHIHVVLKLLGSARTLMRVVATIKSAIRYRCQARGLSVVWQNGFHDHIVRDGEQSSTFVAYTLENPVRKKMVQRYQDYPFCARIDEC